MTNKPILIVVSSDLHHTYDSIKICGIALKDSDAQKLYSKALKDHNVTTRHDGTDDNDYVISVYRTQSGVYSADIIRDEAEKCYSSDGN